MSIDFHLLTSGAAIDEVLDENGKARPPIVLSNESGGFKNAGMAEGWKVMEKMKDFLFKGFVIRDVNVFSE